MKTRSRTLHKRGKPRLVGSVKKKRECCSSVSWKPKCTRSMMAKFRAVPASFATVAHLPTEMLLHIFSLLNHRDLINASHVCQRWQDIANDFTLWKSVYAFGDSITTSELVAVIRSQPRLRRLTLDTRSDCDVVLAAVARYAPNVRALSILGSRGTVRRKNICATPLVKVLRSCRSLSELRIEGSVFRSCVFYRYLLGDLQGKLKRLRLIVNPTRREWECLYRAQAQQQLVIADLTPAL